MRALRVFLLAAVLGLVGALVPVSAPALSFPATLTADRALGNLSGPGRAVHTAFPVEYLGVSWLAGREPLVRFEVGESWTRWERVHPDVDLPSDGARTYSDLLWARGADAYQIRGLDTAVRAVAINTTDGPRSWTWHPPTASALSEPGVVSRAQWGADESYRFDSSGKEVWPPAFYPTQKLVVHHTAGSNSDSQDFTATVRAIYYYHAVTRGYGDIGYNFLIDRQGNVYKGRWSGPAGSRDQSQDSPTGENTQGYGVTAAHTGGYNSGTVGVAVMGTYSTTDITPASHDALVNFLAWESEHHGLDPQASSTYTNPVNGTQKLEPNISGHRDWAATECPGDIMYSELPQIRQEVADRIAGSPSPPPPATSPAAPSLSASTASSKGVQLRWTVPNDGGSAITGYRIYRGRSAGSETFLTAVGNVTSYTDTGTKRDKLYYYKVSAVNSVGEGQRSNEASAKAT